VGRRPKKVAVNGGLSWRFLNPSLPTVFGMISWKSPAHSGQTRTSLACDHRQCRGDIPISTMRDGDFHEIIPNFYHCLHMWYNDNSSNFVIFQLYLHFI
jgi:hypothetical protein